MNRKKKMFFSILVISILSTFMVTGCGSEKTKFDEAAFKEGMEAVIASPDIITGDKAITLLYEKGGDGTGEYTMDYVPEEYKTDNPEEVRYIISRKEEGEFRGVYMGSGCSANRYKYTIEVKDLKLDTSIEKIFYGGEPPMSISVKQGETRVVYGSKPNEEAITEWLCLALQGINPDLAEQTETETEETQTEEMQTEETQTEETETEEPKDPKQAALEKAIEYIEIGIGVAPSELENILIEYEGFDSEAAKYAVENCGADWKQEALKCAKTYDENSWGFSYSILYDALVTNHGFTEEEAQYAVDNCGNDWDKAAVDYVAWMLKYSEVTYTREEMIEEMVEYAGFTEEQAIYGVDQNNLK